jgi:SAM-dependent methyltransferase
MSEPSACAACGAKLVTWCIASHPPGFRVDQCSACGLGMTVPQLSPAELNSWYPCEYYGPNNLRFHPAIEWLLRRLHGGIAQAILESWDAASGRALDIGCGRGWTLAAFRDAGWQTVGVERSGESSAFARERLGLDVRTSGFEPQDFAGQTFDVVILSHVVEHLPNAPSMLEAAAGLVAPGGALLVAVPNLASWQSQLTRGAWFHLDLPRHQWHFTADWLEEKLVGLGFRISLVSHVSLEQNVFGWLQSLLNRLGLRHNLLYDLIRRQDARQTARPWRTHPLQSAASCVLGALLLPWAFLMVGLEGICRRGGTVEIIAVKTGEAAR